MSIVNEWDAQVIAVSVSVLQEIEAQLTRRRMDGSPAPQGDVDNVVRIYCAKLLRRGTP